MKARLLIALIAALVICCAMPALAGKPADVLASSSLDGGLSARWFDFSGPKDIVTIAMQEMEFNGLLADTSSFSAKLKKSIALDPVFVQSLDETYPDYYIICMSAEGKIGVIAIMAVDGKKCKFMEAHNFTPQDVYPAVTETEAKIFAKAKGKNVDGIKGKLVFKFSKECPGAAIPAWDFDGVKVSQKGEAFDSFGAEVSLLKK